MGQRVSRTDFEWSNTTDEPHATRRKLILAKYPQIKSLMGCDPKFKWIIGFLVIFQILSAWIVKDFSWPLLFLSAYVVGGTINHSLSLAIHEIAHNLAFGHSYPIANRLLGMFANIPLGIPVSISFRKYHLEHHRYQGNEVIDVDLPTKLEAKLFDRTFTKLLWIFLQPVFYAIRPLCVRPLPLSFLEILSIVVQLTADAIIFILFGPKSLVYWIGGTLMATGLHPVAGHFISEHYMFKKGYETYSYYGPLNTITFNVGYHNEHHDFPSIPGSRLPQVTKIAAEFYENLPCHHSWVKVLWDFVMDPDIGPYARIKRKNPDKSVQKVIDTKKGINL